MILLALVSSPTARAQSVTAIPKLDLNQFTGTWYEIERTPIKREKRCVSNGMFLFALGDKANSFQTVISCKIKDDNSDSWNAKGKLDKAGDGKLKLIYFWPFSEKDWVLATGPTYEWALIGNPNHKSLWILSRTTGLDPAVLSQIEATAKSQGFNTSTLIKIPQKK